MHNRAPRVGAPFLVMMVMMGMGKARVSIWPSAILSGALLSGIFYFDSRMCNVSLFENFANFSLNCGKTALFNIRNDV